MFGESLEMTREGLCFPDVGKSYDPIVNYDEDIIIVNSHRYPGAEIEIAFAGTFAGGCEITLRGEGCDYFPNGDEFTHKCYEYLGEERFIVHKGVAEHVVKWDETEMEFPEDLAREICDFVIFGIDEA